LKPCCENYGVWASRLRLAYLQRAKQERRTNVSASSLWPTAKALTGGANSKRTERQAGGPDLQESVQSWMTPRTVHGQYTRDRGQTGAERLTLEGQAMMQSLWKTPDVPNGGRGMPKGATMTGMLENGGKRQVGLENQARQWPTPRSRDHKGGGPTVIRKDGKSRMDQLDYNAEHGFSHPDQAISGLGALSFDQRRTLHRLLADLGLFKRPGSISRPYSVPSRSAPTNPLRAQYQIAQSYSIWCKKRNQHWQAKRLNPQFVEWLMGWPTGHALCACSEMAFSHWLQDMRGALLRLPMALGPWIWKPPAHHETPQQMSMFDE
jgi:hypothetical protein